MTDKQIIIDGENIERIKTLLFEGQRGAISTKTFEAIIEALERKEQECEKLKNWVKNMMFDTDRNDWFEHFTECFENWKEGLFKQLDQLKEENKEYKNIIDKLAGKTIAITSDDKPFEFCDHKDLTIKQLKAELKDMTIRKIDYLKESLTYKQALQEIKEIANKTLWTYSNLDDVTKYNMFDKILQKISEVLDV